LEGLNIPSRLRTPVTDTVRAQVALEQCQGGTPHAGQVGGRPPLRRAAVVLAEGDAQLPVQVILHDDEVAAPLLSAVAVLLPLVRLKPASQAGPEGNRVEPPEGPPQVSCEGMPSGRAKKRFSQVRRRRPKVSMSSRVSAPAMTAQIPETQIWGPLRVVPGQVRVIIVEVSAEHDLELHALRSLAERQGLPLLARSIAGRNF